MTAAGSVAPTDVGRRRSMLLLGLAAALVVLDLVAATVTGGLRRDPLAASTFSIALAALVVAGAVLVRDRRHTGLGRLLLGAAATGALWDAMAAAATVGPIGFLQNVVSWGYAGLLIHLLVRWPDARIDGPVAKGLVLAIYLVMPLLTLLWQLVWDPVWFGGELADQPWLTVVADRGLAVLVWQVQQVLLVALVAALVGVVAVRVAAARGVRRAAMAPVAVVALALGVTEVLGVVRGLGAPVPFDPLVVQNVALLAIPVAVLGAAVRAPAGIDEPTVPGRRLHPGDAARARYHLGFAGVTAAVVVVVSVALVLSLDGWTNGTPTPEPGPVLVSH